VTAFDSLEKIRAWRNLNEFKETPKIGDKHARYRSYAIDGVPQQGLRPSPV
jgi:heme-degrading monooxygenase HmoA